MGYCTRANVYGLGLAPRAFARPAEPIEIADPATGRLALRSHGLSTDHPIELRVISSSTLGAAPAALPAGLVEGPYFAQPGGVSDSFQVSLATGGTPISSFGDAGSGVFAVIVDHGPYLDAAIDAATATIDVYAVAHKAPIQAAVLPFVSAFLAARIYVAAHAAANPLFAKMADPPDYLRAIVDKMFSLWVSGVPLAGAIDATPTKAEMGAVAVRLKSRHFLEDEESRV